MYVYNSKNLHLLCFILLEGWTMRWVYETIQHVLALSAWDTERELQARACIRFLLGEKKGGHPKMCPSFLINYHRGRQKDVLES